MKIINTDYSMFFDVDQTLVMWEKSEMYSKEVIVKDPYTGAEEVLYVNTAHVKLLMRVKGKGRTVVVWSHGGHLWAAAVVRALGIESFVDFVMTKVEDFVDDLEITQWPTKNLYLHRGYGK